ncbi:MAG: S9 family peptidase [Marinilabiliales bacterium]|nr:MAG: S9 family peptidase [Marinilabiliales bacterium]
MQKIILSFLVLVIPLVSSAGSIPLTSWLMVQGPDPELPAFSGTENMEGKTFGHNELFSFNPRDLNDHYPQYNKVFIGEGPSAKRWTTGHANDTGFVEAGVPGTGSASNAWLATYITVDRWMKAELEIHSRQMMEVYLNGNRLGSKNTRQKPDADPAKWTSEVELTNGKHLLLIRTSIAGDDESPWLLSARVNLPEYAQENDLYTDLTPGQGKTLSHLLDGVKTGGAAISSGGKYYTISFSRTLPPSDRSERWTEVRRVGDGQMMHSFRHASVSSFTWTPDDNIISYRTSRDGKSTIWTHNLESGEIIPVLEDVENMGSFSWTPCGNYIVYSIREEGPEEEGSTKRIIGMQDRIPGFRNRNFLHRVNVSTGIRERLTHGFLTTSLHDISPCGKLILFSQSRPDYLERPYSKQDVFIMEMDTRETDTILHNKRWAVSGSFSPDGRKILFTGGPSAFGGLGESIPEGMIANNYDTQAYIYDIESGETDPITREFDPSVSQALWNKADNNIYLVAGEEDFLRLFRYNTRNRRFQVIETGEDIISGLRVADNQPLAVYSGSGMSSPPKVSILDLRNGRYRELENTDNHNFRNVVFGNSLEWDFHNSQGARIPGRVYLPPGFDESKKYPLIVYYYGGTTPVSRSFGGRYPFNMYAASGYVVYVLQPSGAIGFGQEFSALHVNNWGITVADEIIDGTRRFLDAHPFIDPERVGCMGASYGGFMTMLLTTRTDIFAAAISHAGISSISSYWGEGYWGYGYSAEASAESFPWNNRELYVDQSPLFSADRINTPLLLITGDQDTNVPPGESIQLYVALRLLGRPVELVKVEGEDHHILTYTKRIEWSNTKMAWFDKWLKNQSEWWENLYPEKNL